MTKPQYLDICDSSFEGSVTNARTKVVQSQSGIGTERQIRVIYSDPLTSYVIEGYIE